jgi:hypothetical protein
LLGSTHTHTDGWTIEERRRLTLELRTHSCLLLSLPLRALFSTTVSLSSSWSVLVHSCQSSTYRHHSPSNDRSKLPKDGQSARGEVQGGVPVSSPRRSQHLSTSPSDLWTAWLRIHGCINMLSAHRTPLSHHLATSILVEPKTDAILSPSPRSLQNRFCAFFCSLCYSPNRLCALSSSRRAIRCQHASSS